MFNDLDPRLFAKLVDAKSVGDARYTSQDPFIQSTLSHTILTPIYIWSAFFLPQMQIGFSQPVTSINDYIILPWPMACWRVTSFCAIGMPCRNCFDGLKLKEIIAKLIIIYIFAFYCRACIAIATLFVLSASGIFIRAIRSLVVEKHPIRVSLIIFYQKVQDRLADNFGQNQSQTGLNRLS